MARAAEMYPRHNWLAAAIPADARRFRVSDPKLASTLLDAGAEIVESDADVEIASPQGLEGAAPYAVVPLEHVPTEGGSRAARVWKRSSGSARVRLRARGVRAAVKRLGYSETAVLLWEWEQFVRVPGLPAPQPLTIAERMPLGALVVGSRRGTPPSVLDDVVAAARRAAGEALNPSWPLVRQGGLVVIADGGVLRIALGPARREMYLLREALDALRGASPAEVVAGRVPWMLDGGEAGLAEWTLERRLPGSEPPAELTEELLSDCVDFLAALFTAGNGSRTGPSLPQRAKIIAEACDRRGAETLERVARRLEEDLAAVPRGFVHGDFWIRNLLVEEGRLVGVVDWHGAAPGGLPLLDLFHLRLSSVFERTRQYLGTALVEHLVPWARAGGDEVARSYCAQIGLDPTAELLESLVVGYWLTRTARELEMYADRRQRPVWMRHNVAEVVDWLAAERRVLAKP